MHIQLIVDPITNRINGWLNKSNDDFSSKDDILIDLPPTHFLFSSASFDNLFYYDGEIVKLNETVVDDENYDIQINSLYNEIATYDTTDENTILMNALLDGSSIEEGVAMVKKNRERLDKKRKQAEDLTNKHKKEIEKYWQDKMKKEEQNINYDYFVSILLLIRDENEYIEEWLEHHINTLGFDHIFIYDNESKVPVKQYLESVNSPFIDKITFVDWPTTEHNTQEDALNHFLKTYGDTTEWLLHIDTDEFIQLNDDFTVKDILTNNEDYSAILCQWIHYGANGHDTRTEGGVLERFTKSSEENYHLPNSGKYFVRTNRCNFFMRYLPDMRNCCKCLNDENNNLHTLQLNHYITKSYEEWKEKIGRGTCDPDFPRREQLFFEINPDMEYINDGSNNVQSYGSNVKTI